MITTYHKITPFCYKTYYTKTKETNYIQHLQIHHKHKNTQKRHHLTQQTKHTQVTHYHNHYIPITGKIDGLMKATAPWINTSEASLTEAQYHTLAQLRISKSLFLLSYLHEVGPLHSPSLLCPFSNTQVHDTTHLFTCTHVSNTQLKILDLWTSPTTQVLLFRRHSININDICSLHKIILMKE